MAGRPSDIDRVVRTMPDGTKLTVADIVVASLRAGNYIEAAAATAGIARQTVYEWRHVAARARIAHATAPSKMSAHEKRCVQFSDAVDDAQASWEAEAITTLERLGRGGIAQTIVTEKRGPDNEDGTPGPLIERVVRSTSSMPDARVIEWRLTRMHPDRYATRVEVTGADGGPVELTMQERTAALMDLLDASRSAPAGPATNTGGPRGDAVKRPSRRPHVKPAAPAAPSIPPPASNGDGGA